MRREKRRKIVWALLCVIAVQIICMGAMPGMSAQATETGGTAVTTQIDGTLESTPQTSDTGNDAGVSNGSTSDTGDTTNTSDTTGTADDTEKIPVTKIELECSQDHVGVGEQVSVSGTVVPSNATDTMITYTSSNEAVATVNSSGTVTGVSVGNVTITATAGEVSNSIDLQVVIETTSIELNSEYVVLATGETFTISAVAYPQGTSQAFTYKTKNSQTATVEGNVIRAVSAGSTVVIVNNGEMVKAVTVIVNGGVVSGRNTSSASSTHEASTENAVEENTVVTSIRENGGQTLKMSISQVPTLTKSMLRALKDSDTELTLESTSYTLEIKGSDIINCENELNTYLHLEQVEAGSEITVNDGNNLPGKVIIHLAEQTGAYLYLYNEEKEKYQPLDAIDEKTLTLDMGGRYLLADEKINGLKIQRQAVIGAGIVIGILCVGYIMGKKKYWFW